MKNNIGYFRSFNESSTVDDKLNEKISENIITDYDSLDYVRYMKLFKPQKKNFHIGNFTSSKLPNGVDINKYYNEPFHLRFYMPKKMITRRKKENNRIVVMFNGMNEDTRYDLYDLLGEHFAKNNMAAVLLPTPLHLNRKIPDIIIRDSTGRRIKPIEWAEENPLLFYHSFLKSYCELNELVHKINHPRKAEFHDRLDKAFYQNMFWDKKNSWTKTEIILLGYSLGGSKALSFFMQDPEKYRCCITINSGAKLSDAHTQKLEISDEVWSKMMRKVREQVDKFSHKSASFEKSIKLHESKLGRLRDIFLTLYFGQGRPVAEAQFEKIIKQYLSIMSGSDRIVDIDQMKTIAPKDKHINQLIVAGVEHHLTMDQNWYEVLPRVEKNIIDFINSCTEDHYKKQDVADEMRTLLEKTVSFNAYYLDFQTAKRTKGGEQYHYPEHFENDELITLLNEISKEDKDKFYKLYYISKAYYPNFPELFDKALRDYDRKKRQEGIRKENEASEYSIEKSGGISKSGLRDVKKKNPANLPNPVHSQ